MVAQLNEHNMLGSYSERIMDAAYNAGYAAGKAGSDRRAPQFVYVRERRVDLTGFTRNDWFRGYDQAVRDAETIKQEEVALTCDNNAEALETYLDELTEVAKVVCDVESEKRQEAKQLLVDAGFTRVGTMKIKEFGLPTVYSCYCDRGKAANRVPLDQLVPTVKGWIDAEQGWQAYRKVRLSIV